MTDKQTISEELLALLRCPIGRGPLVQQGEYLVCESCGVRFAIRDGIPALVRSQAILPDNVATLEELNCTAKAD